MSDELTIITNSQPRAVLRWYELSPKEQAEFDYLETSDQQDDAEFMRYQGAVYDLHEIARGMAGSGMPECFKAWDSYLNDTFFSGVLIRWIDNGERVIAGRFYS